MLFGLCCAAGIRLGAKKTARLVRVRSLHGDLRILSERTMSGCETLVALSTALSGILFETIGAYLRALSQGSAEEDAAEQALAQGRFGETEREGMRMFLTGLSASTRNDLIKRIRVLETVLERAEREAEPQAKQARVLRISGVLAGAGLAILLL